MDARDALFRNPVYMPVVVKLSDGARQDWDDYPYDEAIYTVRAELIGANITRLDLYHWSPLIENSANHWSVNSLIHPAPLSLRHILKPLAYLYQPLENRRPNKLYRNYEAFMETAGSLACLVNLSCPDYENLHVVFPAHILEWDMTGSIEVSKYSVLLLEGGEIESSNGCKSSVDKHPLL